jgi:hypothetical protein
MDPVQELLAQHFSAHNSKDATRGMQD